MFTGVANKRFYGTLSVFSPSGAKITWTEVPGSQSFSSSAYSFLWKGNGQFSLTLNGSGTPIALPVHDHCRWLHPRRREGSPSAPVRCRQSLSANPVAGPAPLHTHLSDVGTSVRLGDWYSLNFGDKSPSHIAVTVGSVGHTYSAARTYTAVLTVKNAAGQTAAASITLDTRG